MLILYAAALLAQSVPGATPPPPNVVVVYADDMGWGDLGVQNAESRIPTPNLDRFAAEGVRCTDAHSSSGICTPSRFALLSGTYHWRRLHGIVRPFGGSVFTASDVTLAELLQGHGYDTACIGKWHLGWDWEALRRQGAEADPKRGFAPGDFDWTRPIPDGPLAHGFGHYFGDDVPNFPPYGWIRDDRLVEAPTRALVVDPTPAEGSAESRPGPMVEGWRQDAVMPRLTARAVAWLEEPARRERPFFLYFAWTSPHAPISPAAEYRGATQAGGYGDFVHQGDAHFGAVMEALERGGLAENTLVVFTSDNGPEHYAYERTRDRQHRSTGPLRGLKRDVFEGGHRVPFLVRWPGVIPAGQTCGALTSQIDLYRTLAAATGAGVPEGAAEDSLDQLPVWRGETPAVRFEHVHNTYAGRWALRSGEWVLIDGPTGTHTRVPDWFHESDGLPASGEGPQLFRLSDDLGQRVNRSAEHPGVVERLRRRLAHFGG